VHHFAHHRRDDDDRAGCDDWAERDTTWHRDWQARVPIGCREVVIGPHLADIRTPAGVVVELQHASLTGAQIQEREAFYGPGLVWLFDARDPYLQRRLTLADRGGYVSLRWAAPRRGLRVCHRPVFLDLGQLGVFRPVDLWTDRLVFTGWGRLFKPHQVIRAWMGGQR
jgi:hypothetical protein